MNNLAMNIRAALAAESSGQIGVDASPMLKAMNAVLRIEIRDEFRRIMKDAEGYDR